MAKIHGIQGRIYVDGYNLSGDSASFDVSYALDVTEVTGLGEARKNYLTGLADGSIQHSGIFNDDVASGIHEVLRNRIGRQDLQVLVAHGTSVGSYGWAGSAVTMPNYSVSAPIGDKVAVTSGYQTVGTVGFDPIRLAATTDQGDISGSGASIDDGAGSNAGLRGYLHIVSVASGTPVVAIQSSTAATGPTWVSRITFTGATARWAEAAAASGTVDRYIRCDITNGTARLVCGWRRL